VRQQWLFLGRLGQRGMFTLSWLGGLVLFTTDALYNCWRMPGFFNSLGIQTVITYRRCTLPVIFMLIPLGAMLGLQGLLVVQAFDLERLFSAQLVSALVREMAPGFSALMVAMQAGAGMTAELGTMSVRQETSALEAMGLPPNSFLGGPRILATTLATALLCPLGAMAGIFGAFLYAVVLSGFPIHQFTAHLGDLISFSDLWIAEMKCLVFGLLTGVICTEAGLRTPQKTAAQVGASANKAVVRCVVLLVVSNYVLNTAIYGLRG
jgi:phospholipid/cholesterol/gamma-HCH transport system permease protein